MKRVFNTKEQLHHAYILEGSESQLPKLLEFIEDLFNFSSGHPDVFIHTADMFGVEDAQILISKNSQKAVHGGEKIIITTLRSISHQAQNNLLKTLEEPSPGTYIFLISPSASIFLPTIRSRVHLLESFSDGEVDIASEVGGKKKSSGDSSVDGMGDGMNTVSISKLAKRFIESEIPSRLEIVKKILGDKEDEIIDDSFIFEFVKNIEMIVCTHEANALDTISSQKKTDKDNMSEGYLNKRISNAKIFTNIYEYLYDTSSSKKLILENLALMIKA